MKTQKAKRQLAITESSHASIGKNKQVSNKKEEHHGVILCIQHQLLEGVSSGH